MAPRGTSIPTATSLIRFSVSSANHCRNCCWATPVCSTLRDATNAPSASRTTTRCRSLPQSTPTNHRYGLVNFQRLLAIRVPTCRDEHRPCTGARGANSPRDFRRGPRRQGAGPGPALSRGGPFGAPDGWSSYAPVYLIRLLFGRVQGVHPPTWNPG